MTLVKRYESIKVVDSIRDSFRRQIQSSSRLIKSQIEKKRVSLAKHFDHTHDDHDHDHDHNIINIPSKTYLNKPPNSSASTTANKTIQIEKVYVPRMRHVTFFLLSVQLKCFIKILYTCVKTSSIINVSIKTCLSSVRNCSSWTHHKPDMLFIAEKIVHP